MTGWEGETSIETSRRQGRMDVSLHNDDGKMNGKTR